MAKVSDKTKAIIDLPGGTFALRPNPTDVRGWRLTSTVFLVFGSALIVVALIKNTPHVSWQFWLGVVAVFGAMEWLLWNTVKPAPLKADATEISRADLIGARTLGLDPECMPRADLAFVLRGQVRRLAARNRIYWDKSYIFVASDGKVGMSFSTHSFTEDGMAEFAQRLQVQIRGDFSVQVTDRVDPTT